MHQKPLFPRLKVLMKYLLFPTVKSRTGTVLMYREIENNVNNTVQRKLLLDSSTCTFRPGLVLVEVSFLTLLPWFIIIVIYVVLVWTK